MLRQFRTAALNVKLLVIIAAIGIILIAGLYFARKYRQGLIAAEARTKGIAAVEAARAHVAAGEYEASIVDWNTARTFLLRASSMRPTDTDLLPLLAEANLSGRPVAGAQVGQAARALRRLLRVDPDHRDYFETLVRLYQTAGDTDEILQITRLRAEAVSDDVLVPLWEARVALMRQDPERAEQLLREVVANGADQPPDPAVTEACVLLAGIKLLEADAGAPPALQTAREWADRAVAVGADEPYARVRRAALLRRLAAQATDPDARNTLVDAAKDDLQRAEAALETDARAILLLVEEWLAYGQTQQADRALSLAKNLAPQHYQRYFTDPNQWTVAVFLLDVQLALATGDTERGERIAREALAALRPFPHVNQVRPLAIEMLISNGAIQDAQRELLDFETEMETRPRSVERDARIAFLKARLAALDGQHYEVIRLLEQYAERPDARPALRQLLAEAFQQTGQTQRLENILARINDAAGDPQAVFAMRMRLLTLRLQQQRWEDVLTLINRFPPTQRGNREIQLAGLTARIGLEMRSTPLNRERITELERAIETLSAENPEWTQPVLLRATLAEARGDVDAARRILVEHLENDPETPVAALFARAGIEERAGDPDAALRVYTQATERFSDDAATWVALSDFHQRRGDDPAALQTLAAALQAVPEEARTPIRARRAITRAAEGEIDSAIDELRQLVEANPADINLKNALLACLHEAGLTNRTNLQLAANTIIELARQQGATVIDADGTRINDIRGGSGLSWRYELARYWMAKPTWRSKRAEIESLLRWCLKETDAWVAPAALLGELHERVRSWSEAEAVYTRGFEATGNPELARRLVRALQRQGRLEDARAVFAQLRDQLGDQQRGEIGLQMALRADDYETALQELRARRSSGSTTAADLVTLALVEYAETNNAETALQALDEAEAAGADPIPLAAARARIWAGEEQLDQADTVLTKLIEANPTSDAYRLRGALRANNGRRADAERDFNRMIELADSDWPYMAMTEFYLQEDKPAEAVRYAEQGLNAYPDSAVLKRARAAALLARNAAGDADDAEVLLTELITRQPADPHLYYLLASAYLKQNGDDQADAARNVLRNALQADLGTLDTMRGLTLRAVEVQDDELTLALAQRGLETYPGDPILCGLIAPAEIRLNRLDQAAAHLETFLSSDAGAEEVQLLISLIQIHQQQERFDRAARWLARLIQRAPQRPETLQVRVVQAAADERFDEIPAIVAATNDDGNLAEGFTFAAWVLRQSGHAPREEVLALADRAISLDPQATGALELRAMVLYETGDITRAEAAYERIIELAPNNANARNNLAWIKFDSRAEPDEAFPHAQRAVELAPNEPNFRDTLGQILLAQGRARAALIEFQRGLSNASAPAQQGPLVFHLAQAAAATQDRAAVRQHDDLISRALSSPNVFGLSPEQVRRLVEIRN